MQKFSKVALFCISFSASLIPCLIECSQIFIFWRSVCYHTFFLVESIKKKKKSSLTQISSWKRNILITFSDNSGYSWIVFWQVEVSWRWVVVCSLKPHLNFPCSVKWKPTGMQQKDFRHTSHLSRAIFLKCPQD